MNQGNGMRVGQVLPDGLRLVEAVGRGGMGEVWRAFDPVLQRDVAVKILHPRRPDEDPDATDEFARQQREARACARVVHRNVVSIYGIGAVDDRPYIAMEWLGGDTLRDVIDGPSTPTWRETLGWIRALISAVQHAHDSGVVHCDIKPANVLLERTAASVRRPKLVDFGIARGANLAHRRPVQHRGTDGYLAPETGISRPSPAGDQFALAVTLLELLAGSRPTRRHGMLELPRKNVLTDPVCHVFRRALADDPAGRYFSVQAMGDALLAALGPSDRPIVLLAGGSDLDQLDDDMRIDATWLAGLPRGQLRRVALAIIATAPAGFHEALQRIAALPHNSALADVLDDLRAEGWIEGGLGEWRLIQPALRDAVLDPLGGRIRRAVSRAVADALAREPDQGWKHAAAVRLYIDTGDLDRAASLLATQAESATTAVQRDHVLLQRVTLLGSPRHEDSWLRALLQRLDWVLACGWAKKGATILPDVLEVASRLEVDPGSDAGVHIAACDAYLRLLRGDADRALSRLGTLSGGHGIGPARHLVARIAALNALSRHREVLDLPGLESIVEAAEPGPLAAIAASFSANGDSVMARTLLRRALAAQLDAGDRLGAMTTMVRLAETWLAAGSYSEALDACMDAEELSDTLGSTRWTGRTRALRAEVALARGDTISAIRFMEGGCNAAREHGCSADLRVYSARADAIARRLVQLRGPGAIPASAFAHPPSPGQGR